MLVREIMTPAPSCCTPETRLDVVAKMMLNHNCGAIPVCDGGRVVGLITDRDITCRAVAKGMTPMAVSAAQIMSRPAYTVRENEEVQAALTIMRQRRIRRLPVVYENGLIAGIVTETDIATHLPPLEIANLVRHVANRRATVP